MLEEKDESRVGNQVNGKQGQNVYMKVEHGKERKPVYLGAYVVYKKKTKKKPKKTKKNNNYKYKYKK